MMFTNRAGAVVRSVKTVFADHMFARVQNMSSTRAATEQTGLFCCLEEMDEHLLPPKSTRIGRNSVRKVPEQRLMLLVSTTVGKQDSQCPCPKAHQLVERTPYEALSQARCEHVTDSREL
jgi:hypothetical protein